MKISFTKLYIVQARVYNIVGGEYLTLNIPCINPLLQIKPVYYSKT